MNKSFLLPLLLLLFSSFAIAEESFIFKTDKTATFQIAMANADLSPCLICTCTFDLFYPNGTTFVSDTGNNNNGYCVFNATPKLLGKYSVEVVFTDGTDSGRSTFEFEVNPTGEQQNGWRITIKIFASITALILVVFFLFLSSIKTETETNEKSAIRLFFVGLAFVFFVGHIIMISSTVNDTIGEGNLSNNYTYLMYAFFVIIGLMFLYIVAKITFREMDSFQRRVGLK